MRCSEPDGQRLLQELLEVGCFSASGKVFDASGLDATDSQSMAELERLEIVRKLERHAGQESSVCYQFTEKAEMLFEAKQSTKLQLAGYFSPTFLRYGF